MEKIYTVVVMYNSNINESQTCKRLVSIKNHDIEPIIVDNSTFDNDNEVLCVRRNWKYISMGGNKGLSKAYNKALDYLAEKKGIVVWFDDDTNVTQKYFDELEKEYSKKRECSIFVPVIQGQDGRYWSPNSVSFFRNKQLKNKDGKIDDSKFNAINSCTAVDLEVYENYRYDERLFLDQVDHKFFEDQRNLNRKFDKLDVVIQHNFSTREKKKSIEDVKKRYVIMIPDFLRFCSRNKKYYLLGMIKVFGWGVRESIKYKNITFLVWCMHESMKYPYRKIKL